MSTPLEKAKLALKTALTSPRARAKGVRPICRSIAKTYSVKESTLRMYWLRSQKAQDRPHGNMLFSRLQETQLVGYILALEQLGCPPSKGKVCQSFDDIVFYLINHLLIT